MSRTRKYSRSYGRKRSRSSSRRRNRTRSRSRTRTRSRRGGADSAWAYEYKTLGDINTQIRNSLETSPAQNLATSQSNAIVPVSNVNAQNTQPYLNPNLSTHKGGRRRSKKGGFWGSIIQQAAAPLALLGLQQSYKRKSHRR